MKRTNEPQTLKTYSVIQFSDSDMGLVATTIKTFGATDDEQATKCFPGFQPPVGKELYSFGSRPKSFLFEVAFEKGKPQLRLVCGED